MLGLWQKVSVYWKKHGTSLTTNDDDDNDDNDDEDDGKPSTRTSTREEVKGTEPLEREADAKGNATVATEPMEAEKNKSADDLAMEEPTTLEERSNKPSHHQAEEHPPTCTKMDTTVPCTSASIPTIEETERADLPRSSPRKEEETPEPSTTTEQKLSEEPEVMVAMEITDGAETATQEEQLISEEAQSVTMKIAEEAIATFIATESRPSSDDDDDSDDSKSEASYQGVKGFRVKGFPLILRDILDREFSDGIAWLPHGRGFKIHNPKKFETDVLPHHFPNCKLFRSFTIRLKRWGFNLCKTGPDKGAYHRENFVRDEPNDMSMVQPMSKKPMNRQKKPIINNSSERKPTPELQQDSQSRSETKPTPELQQDSSQSQIRQQIQYLQQEHMRNQMRMIQQAQEQELRRILRQQLPLNNQTVNQNPQRLLNPPVENYQQILSQRIESFQWQRLLMQQQLQQHLPPMNPLLAPTTEPPLFDRPTVPPETNQNLLERSEES